MSVWLDSLGILNLTQTLTQTCMHTQHLCTLGITQDLWIQLEVVHQDWPCHLRLCDQHAVSLCYLGNQYLGER